MNSARRIESTSIKKDLQQYCSKKESKVNDAMRKMQNGRSQDELTEMISVFKQFLAYAKGRKGQSRLEEQCEDSRELQPRDRIVIVPLPSEQLTEDELEKFLSKLCKIVWSRAFNYFSKDELSYEYTKIYSSEEILRNIVRLSQKFQLTPRHFEIINRHLQDRLLEYNMAKYPITQLQDVNRNFHNAIRQVDNTDQPQNDYVFNSAVSFKFRESGEYNDLIMRLINQIIKKIEFKISTKTVYRNFQEKMERLFDSVFDEDWAKEAELDKPIIDDLESRENLQLIRNKHSQSEQQFKKELAKIKEKQKEKYRNKVQEYTSYKIGKKLPDSTRPFTEQEICSHNLKIENPQILRILTKWCDQLQKKFTTPNYFEHYIQTLKLENGKYLVLVLNEVKQRLDQLMAEEYRNIKEEVAEMAKNNYFMQSQLLFHQLKHFKSSQIEKYESIAAKYSIDIVNNLHTYTLAYLNRLIHGLLTVSARFAKLPVVSQFEWPSSISLITCQINDLVRCRCASGQRETIRVYNQLLRWCEADRMQLVKVSNRLKRGTLDVVITVKYRQVLCEIQLSVTNKIHKYAEYSNSFNHYLYQLKRSVFGPLTQLCNVWKSNDGRFAVYKNLAPQKINPLFGRLEHECEYRNEYQVQDKPFICSSCNNHRYHNNYIKRHFKCKYCTFWVCARCQLDSSDCKSMLAAAYKQDEIINRSNRIKRKGNTIIPDYGICIFIQSQSIKVEPFRKYHAKGKASIIGVKNKQLYQIYDVTTEKDKINFKQDFLIFQVGEAYGKRHIKIDDQRIGQFFISQKLKSIYQRNKEKICLNYGNITNQQFVSLCKLGTPAQRQNIKRVQIIGNKLQSISLISKSFKNIKMLEAGKNNINNFQQISKLQKLQALCVNENRVKQFPQEVCHLWNLKELAFCDNELKTIPEDLNKLHKLKVLKLCNNYIEDFPHCISQLCYLSQLHLRQNKIKEVPDFLGALTQLQVLDLQNNAVTSIHPNISRLRSLQLVNLSHNQLTQMSVAFTSIKSLQQVNMRSNKIASIPPQIDKLQNLTSLNLSINQITHFPSINSLEKLIQLDLSYNLIQNLKEFQCKRMTLKKLNISHNSLKYMPSVQNSIFLEELRLNDNHLQAVPDSLGKLEKLEILHLQNNDISKIGQIRLQTLKFIDVSKNKVTSFSGMDLICVEEIDLSGNCISMFSGNLMPCLKRANLTNNRLQTLQVNHYPKLKYLQAGLNKLQQFPKVDGKSHIKVLNLEHNLIKAIPSDICNYHNIANLNASYNQITVIPKNIQYLSSLKDHVLDFSHNPIEKVEAPEFLLKKCTQATIHELQPMIRGIMAANNMKESQLTSQSSIQIDSQPAIHSQSAKTIEKI